MSFTGKIVIVTGATSGIGRASAEAFGREGASVVAVGRDAAALAGVVAAVVGAGGRAHGCAADVTAGEAPERYARFVFENGRTSIQRPVLWHSDT